MDYMVECPLCKHIFEVERKTPEFYPKNMTCPKCMKKIGFWEDADLNKLGDTAIIGKGTRYHSMKDGEYHIAGKPIQSK